MLKSQTTGLNDWQPLQEFISQHDQFTENQLRWLIRNQHINGFRPVICKVGKRIYLNEGRFVKWMNHDKGDDS